MPTIFENPNRYKVIVLSPDEMRRWPRAAVCDRCGCRRAPTGFYIAAYNLFYCSDCYTEWCAGAQEKQAGVKKQETDYLGHAVMQINASTPILSKINH